MQFLLGLVAGMVLGVSFKDQILKVSTLVVDKVKEIKANKK